MPINNFTTYGQPGYSGYLKYGINNLSVFRKPILLPAGTTIADSATAILEATWIALTKNVMASRIHPFPLATDCKPTGGESVLAKTPLGGDVVIREDVVTLAFTYNVDAQLAAELRKFNRKRWDVAFVDAFDNIIGWTPDGTKFQGFTASTVFFGQMSFSDGSKARENTLTIVLPNPREWNDSPAVIGSDSLTWLPSQLDGTTSVKIAVSDATTAGFTASVNVAGMDASDPNSAYSGLAKADFVLKKAGVSQDLSSATMVDNADGTYTFTMTNTAGSFTLELVAPADNSVAAYNIETPTAGIGSFTIS